MDRNECEIKNSSVHSKIPKNSSLKSETENAYLNDNNRLNFLSQCNQQFNIMLIKIYNNIRCLPQNT
jgi:hypothetical protein